VKYLVTGGCGFVGQHLCKVLEETGHKVTAVTNLSHATCTRPYVYADVRYKSELRDLVKDADGVFHLAARINVDHSLKNPQLFLETNVVGTHNLLDLCREYRFALVIASSSEVYGTNMSEGEHMREAHVMRPRSPYGASKAAADMLALGYFYGFGIPVAILRSFNITGPGQSFDAHGALIPKVMKRVLDGERPIIFGDGLQKRDYVDARDVARAYLLLMERVVKGELHGEVFNVGTMVSRTVKEIVEAVIEISGKDIEPVYVAARVGEVRELLCDAMRAKTVLKWVAGIPFEQTLKDMWEWYSNPSTSVCSNREGTV